MLTAALLREACPKCPGTRAELFARLLNEAWAEFGIEDVRERAMFLAQMAHESGDLRWWEEFASGAAYEGRADLGNTELGDGVRYKGRGPFQLTGRANYRAAGEALGLDLEGDPHVAASFSVGFRVAAWYWRARGIGEIARAGDFEKVTRKINGGMNGYSHRLASYALARQVLKDTV